MRRRSRRGPGSPGSPRPAAGDGACRGAGVHRHQGRLEPVGQAGFCEEAPRRRAVESEVAGAGLVAPERGRQGILGGLAVPARMLATSCRRSIAWARAPAHPPVRQGRPLVVDREEGEVETGLGIEGDLGPAVEVLDPVLADCRGDVHVAREQRLDELLLAREAAEDHGLEARRAAPVLGVRRRARPLRASRRSGGRGRCPPDGRRERRACAGSGGRRRAGRGSPGGPRWACRG